MGKFVDKKNEWVRMDKVKDNKTLQAEYAHFFYVIVVERDGVEKYISTSYPSLYSFTVKLNKALRFDTEGQAIKFIENCYKFDLKNPVVKLACNHIKLM
jgi:hypothetical protein